MDIKILRSDLTAEMKNIFSEDQKRIDHAMNVLRYAELINEKEGGDAVIVTAAAILHDIGIQRAEEKYGSSAGNYQEIEGPPIARDILSDYEFDGDMIDHVCRIIANHHSDKDIDTLEFRIIWDADWLVNIPDEFDVENKPIMERIIKRVFKTSTGRGLASELYLTA
jgi:HD superfamily phosphodiesterase